MSKLKKLDLVDYLLLDYLILYPIPFFVLFKPERLNKPSIDLDLQEIAKHVNFLSKSGLIVTSDKNDRMLKLSVKETDSLLTEAFDYNVYMELLEDSKNKLIAPERFSYPRIKLTNLGVEVWEHFFEPNWSTFCLESEWFGEMGGNRKIILEAGRQELIQEVSSIMLKYIHLYSSKWEEIKPWKPFYWKEFEQGYALEFSFLENGMDLEYSSEDNQKTDTLRKWRKEWKPTWLEGLY